MNAMRPSQWQRGQLGYGTAYGCGCDLTPRRAVNRAGYGEDAGAVAPPPAGSDSTDYYVQQAAAAYASYSAAQDPRIRRAKLAAMIKNYSLLKRKYAGVPLLGDFYTAQLGKMRAELKALDEKIALQQEGEQATRDWRTLGQTSAAVGIVGGVALTGLILALVVQAGRR